jgi:hypothetical protein
VAAWALVFALETLLDPWATGPLARALGWQDRWPHTAVMFLFVLLGDFRIFLLLSHLAARERALARSLREAAAWTLLVPVAAGALRGALGLVAGELPGQVLWLIYELVFAALALWLRARLLPARVGPGWPPLVGFLRAVCAYVALYYGLWATADVLILVGVDAGWALRVIPNQLYYGLTVPFVWLRFFRAPEAGRASR